MSPPTLPGLSGLPKLPPLPGMGRTGHGTSNLGQALGQHFGSFMQSAPGRMLSSIFPGSNVAASTAQTASPHRTADVPGSASPAGGLPTIRLPGGGSIGPPPLAFAGTAATSAPQAGAGSRGATGNFFGSVVSTAGNIPGPAGFAPAALPALVPGNASGVLPGLVGAPGGSPGFGNPSASLPGPGHVPGQLVATAAHVVRTAGNALWGAPPTPPQTAPQLATQNNAARGPVNAPGASPGPGNTPATSPGPGNVPGQVLATVGHVARAVVNALPAAPQTFAQTAPQVAGQTLSNPQTAVMAQAPQGHIQSQTHAPAAQAQASSMQAPGSAPQPGPASAQSAGTPLQPSVGAPLAAQTQAQPARSDVPVAPPGNPVAERGAPAQAAQAPVQPNLAAPPQGAAMLAAVPLTATLAQTPAAQLAGNPQAQAPGNPVAGTAALDAGGPVRAELSGTGTYTADGPGLRRRDRMRVGAHELGQWMLAAAQGHLHLVRPYDADTPREVAKAFQWLFWVLAIVAYGCLALVLVSFLLSFGDLPSAPVMRRWTGEFALSGLLAAVGAWWLGRQLTRASRPPPDPIRR